LGKIVEFDVAGSVVVINDPELVINAALEGVGVAYLYEEYVAPLVAEGRLVSLLEKSALPITDGFFLFYPSRRQNTAALRALIDFLQMELRKQHASVVDLTRTRLRGCIARTTQDQVQAAQSETN
jgi:DNA-binding transcriptional LysR family regulator